MARMLAPQGVTQVTVQQQNYKVDRDGGVTVPDHFVKQLQDIGFTLNISQITLVGTGGQTADLVETLSAEAAAQRGEKMLTARPVAKTAAQLEADRLEQIRQDGLKAIADMQAEQGRTDAAIADAAKGASPDQSAPIPRTPVANPTGVVDTVNSSQQNNPK